MQLFIQNLVTQTRRSFVMGDAAAGSIPTVELGEARSVAGNTLALAGGTAVSAGFYRLSCQFPADLLLTSCQLVKWSPIIKGLPTIFTVTQNNPNK